MNKEVTIGGLIINDQSAPYIIAEVGINHNGELEKAFEMIDVAKAAGVDCVKFQTFKADEFVGDPNQMFTYYSQGKEVTESMLEMFRRYEFNEAQWVKVKAKCDEVGIHFMSTPQNYTDLQVLLKLGISTIKVGSDDFTNIPLIKKYSETGFPIILSIGMSDLSEIYSTLNELGTFDGYPTVLLLCTSIYPTPPEDVNLNKLKALRGAFPNLILGFSDHTQGPLASSLAVAFGAKVFEKHFTLDHNLPGPDHWFSENPQGLTEWVKNIRIAHTMLGSSLLKPAPKEVENKKEFQRVIVASKEIKKGETFSELNLEMKRIPGGNGYSGVFYKNIVNRISNRDYKAGDVITI